MTASAVVVASAPAVASELPPPTPRARPEWNERGKPVYGAPGPEFTPSNVCFARGTAKLVDESKELLAAVAESIGARKDKVNVRAHATSSETDDPHALTERRLKSVVAALAEHGAPRGRLIPTNGGTVDPSTEDEPQGPRCVDFGFRW